MGRSQIKPPAGAPGYVAHEPKGGKTMNGSSDVRFCASTEWGDGPWRKWRWVAIFDLTVAWILHPDSLMGIESATLAEVDQFERDKKYDNA